MHANNNYGLDNDNESPISSYYIKLLHKTDFHSNFLCLWRSSTRSTVTWSQKNHWQIIEQINRQEKF